MPIGHDRRTSSGAEAGGVPELDVVICTYNNAPMLDRVLTALAAQEPAGGSWRVLVVDNNSSDATAAVVARHCEAGAVPGLRRVEEPVQGLTPARVRGVTATTAPWVAFVDDDCLLAPDWVRQASAFAASHPDAGGFGGRVVPTYDQPPPPVLAGYGWAFAEQDLGDEPVTTECLVGAGMVVNRAALVESGWVVRPYLADRVGRRLVSGGDVEIALRLAGTGRPLWYSPALGLRHLVPARRTTMRYLTRMTFGLGTAWSLASALTWPGTRRRWARSITGQLLAGLRPLPRLARRAATGGATARHDALLASGYECGRWLGAARVAALIARRRCLFFGEAAVRRPCPTP